MLYDLEHASYLELNILIVPFEYLEFLITMCFICYQTPTQRVQFPLAIFVCIQSVFIDITHLFSVCYYTKLFVAMS